MIGKVIFFLISLLAAVVTCYLASGIRSSRLKERKIKSLYPLCVLVAFWLIICAATAVVDNELYPVFYTLKALILNIIPYMSIWFLLHFIDSKIVKSNIFLVCVVIMSAFPNVLLLTNPWHRIYLLSYDSPPQMGLLFLINLTISLSSMLIVYVMLFIYIIKNFQKRPVLLLTGAGAVLPIILYAGYLFFPIIKFDISPIGYFFSIIIFVYSLYSSRIKKALSGIYNDTLTNIAKSPEISLGDTLNAAKLISREGCIALETFKVSVWSYDEKSHALKSMICYERPSGNYTVFEDFDLKELKELYELLLSKRMIIIDDTKKINVLSSVQEIYGIDICSIIEAPIWNGNKLSGLICVEQNRCDAYPEKREWTYEEQAFTSSLADLMAIVLANSERQMLKDAESASRAKSQILANMNHEIRTPMNAIINMAELALQSNNLEVVKNHLQTVKQAGAHLLSIINDIFDFSKIDAGKLEIISADYKVESLLQDIINPIRMSLVNSPVRFAVKADNNIPYILNGDEKMIRQAVLNILNNAVKYTETGHISFGIYGEYINNETMNLIFVVQDTGIGIKSEDINRLFTNFSHLDYENKLNMQGLGLGLPISKSIVTAMEGQISVQSEYDKGSIFTISIPQKYKTTEAMSAVKKQRDKSVLVFERRDIYAESILYAVNNLGAECTFVASGTELYNKLEEKEFNYLFMSFPLYEKNEDTIVKLGKNIEVIILAEYGEAIPDLQNYKKNLKLITTPVYCVNIANALNGIYKNESESADKKNKVSFTAPQAKILVVDDIYTNLKVAQGLLTLYSVNIDLCNSGKESIEKIKLTRYDMVFMDHRMPGIDGVEAVKRIRSWEKEQGSSISPVAIVALTANAVSGSMEMFLSNGFNDYMPKPIDTVKLNEVLQKWLPKEKIVYK